MSTITREHIANLIEFNSEGSDCQANAEQWEVHELARIALASLEAEAVGFIVRNKNTGQFGSWMHSKADWFKDDGYEVLRAYITPPAPVSDNEPIQMFGIGSAFKPQIVSVDEVDCDNCAYYQPNICHGEGCPAAMLQGADGALTNEGTIPANTPCKLRDAVDAIRNSGIAIDGEKILAERDVLNSPVIPDGWVACSERMPEDRESVLLWDIDLDDACSGHYSHQTGNFYQAGMIIDNEITHWMPLPATPQQEAE